jgi:hypothetical protein
LTGDGVGPIILAEKNEGGGLTPLDPFNVNVGEVDWVVGPDFSEATLKITNNTTDATDLGLTDPTLTDLTIQLDSLLGDSRYSVLDDMGDPFSGSVVLSEGDMLELTVRFTADGFLPNGAFGGTLNLLTDEGAAFGDTANGTALSFNLAAVQTPEPGSLACWSLLALVGFGFACRRRQRRS